MFFSIPLVKLPAILNNKRRQAWLKLTVYLEIDLYQQERSSVYDSKAREYAIFRLKIFVCMRDATASENAQKFYKINEHQDWMLFFEVNGGFCS